VHQIINTVVIMLEWFVDVVTVMLYRMQIGD